MPSTGDGYGALDYLWPPTSCLQTWLLYELIVFSYSEFSSENCT